MAPRKTTKCGTKGCRKKAVQNGLCATHATETEKSAQVSAPIDNALRVTELEAAQFSASDSEIRNAMAGRRIIELEMAAADRALQDAALKHRMEQEKRKQQYDALGREIEAKKAGYMGFVESLAKKYKVPAEHMTIDPDSRIIREIREGNKS